MQVRDVMTTGVETIGTRESADSAWRLMRTRGIRHLVVEEAGEVVGVVSERDLGGRRGALVRADRTVGELMTRSPVTARPADTVRRAAARLRGRTIGCLPVVEEGDLVGILTVSDVLEVVARGDAPAAPRKMYYARHVHRREAH